MPGVACVCVCAFGRLRVDFMRTSVSVVERIENRHVCATDADVVVVVVSDDDCAAKYV